MGVLFEWDPVKAKSNITKHDVTFDEASTLFRDPFSVTIDDPLHSDVEERLVITGLSHMNRLLVVVFTERGGRIRIITARQATPGERRCYETKTHG